ncbi:MAG: glycosyl hydrolase, partial [Acidobacteriaceae bacterium]
AKNATYSLIDYLDPRATDAFLHITHETYYGAVGDQFGKIVLGFFGDEPDYSENNTTGSPIVPGSAGVPWTPTLLEQFKAQKGYDLTPYLPAWFDGQQTEQSQRAWADYYDVWSGIFRSSFFGEQAAWAKAHNVEYLVHLNHEEAMLSLEASEGDYFRDERFVQVPGIDNLNQLIPSAVHRFDATWGTNNNFPQAEGVGRRGRRLGRRRQVPDKFSTGARGQRTADPGQRAARRRTGRRPGVRAPSTGYAADDLVCQPRRLSDGDWPSRGAGWTVPSG